MTQKGNFWKGLLEIISIFLLSHPTGSLPLALVLPAASLLGAGSQMHLLVNLFHIFMMMWIQSWMKLLPDLLSDPLWLLQASLRTLIKAYFPLWEMAALYCWCLLCWVPFTPSLTCSFSGSLPQGKCNRSYLAQCFSPGWIRPWSCTFSISV